MERLSQEKRIANIAERTVLEMVIEVYGISPIFPCPTAVCAFKDQ